MTDTSTLLLQPSTNFLLATNAEESKLQGAYLYYDENQQDWIRSGKCTGRSFIDRHKEHLRAAKDDSANMNRSRFYTYYPSEKSSRSSGSTKKGIFERLTQYVAAGFDPTCEPTKTLIGKTSTDGGIWDFSEQEIKMVASFSKSKKKKKTVREIMIKVTGYQFELGYDLAISDVSNISGSAGFEAFVGVSTG